jgi:2'-5' RNA ligase
MATHQRRSYSQQPTPAGRWRVFAALPVNDAVREQMRDIRSKLAEYDRQLRWVDPRIAHLTVKFYGETATDRLPVLQRALADATSRARAVTLGTSGVGVFPSASRPRVVWLGLAGDIAHIEQLARAVEATSDAAGVPREQRPFKAHITIARVRDGADTHGLADALAALDIPRVELPIERLQLIRSVLGPQGPTYTTIAEWPLGGGKPG